MKTYKFTISETFYKTIEVEADNAQDAMGKATEILGETSLSHDYIFEDDQDVLLYEKITPLDDSAV